MNSETVSEQTEIDNDIIELEKPKPYEILYVHSGQNARGSLSKDLWDKVLVAFNEKTLKLVLDGKYDYDFDIEWFHWEDNRVSVACSNEVTVQTFSNIIKEIEIGKFNFSSNRYH